LLVLGIFSAPREGRSRFLQTLMAWLALAGCLVDTGLFFISATVLHTVCLLCFGTYLCSFGNLLSNVCMMKATDPKATWLSAFRFGPAGAKGSGTSLMIATVLAIGFACLVVAAPRLLVTHTDIYTLSEPLLLDYYQKWKNKAPVALDIKQADGAFGMPQAKVQIVEFSDFECPHCRRAAFTLHTALKPMEGRIYFVFKQFPLDTSCNPGLSRQVHPHACYLARLAFCAQQKGVFWKYHDRVFLELTEEDIQEGTDAIAAKLKGIFSLEDIEHCLKDEASVRNAIDDIQLGNAVGIRGTPTVFINGKMVSIPLTVDNVRRLVELEEKSR
jgi:protein-disulfide isomerase